MRLAEQARSILRMEIHFCDLCNESVPQADLEGARATIHKGRVICAACHRAMSVHDGLAAEPEALLPASVATVLPVSPANSVPAPAALSAAPAGAPDPTVAAAGRSASGVWLALLALGLAGVALFQQADLRARGEVELEAQRAEGARQDQRIAALQEALARSDLRAKELEAGFEGRLQAEHASSEEALVALAAGARQTKEEGLALRQELDRLRSIAQDGDGTRAQRLAELDGRIARNEQDQQLLVTRFAELEGELQRRTAVAAPAVAASAAPAAPAEPAWTKLLPGLSSEQAGARWEAVDALGQTGEAAVVPHVLPRLRDVDVFVRMAAARVLGDLKAQPAIPQLIDALEDTEVAVREAAYHALRAITGKDHRFDPLASESERAKRVKVWRDWWKREPESGAANPAPAAPAGETPRSS